MRSRWCGGSSWNGPTRSPRTSRRVHARLRARLRRARADQSPILVMISACLNGQTGPHRDYPGFGGQGSALAGYNALTGWADREPVGPNGTITDSLAPRFVATALAAGLLYRRRTGRGVYLDVSQVESAIYSLAPWLLDYEVDGIVRLRTGNRHAGSVPHGAFPCDRRRRRRRRPLGCDRVPRRCRLGRARRIIGVDDASLATTAARTAREDEVEALVAGWTRARTRDASRPHCRPPVSKRFRSRTSATCTMTRNSRRANTSKRSSTRSSVSARTSGTASGSRTRRGLRPGRPDARAGHRLGARRDPRARRLDRRRGQGTRGGRVVARFASLGGRRDVSPSAVLGRDRYRASACRQPRASSHGCRGGCGRDARRGTASASGHG